MSDKTQFLKEDLPLDREQEIESFLRTRLQNYDRAIAGNIAVSLAALSGTVPLTPAQAKNRVVILTGNPVGAVTLTIPHATGANADIIFVNRCGGSFSTVTVKSAGANAGNAAGEVVTGGVTRHLWHDGESVYLAGAAGGGGGVSDHGALSGLGDDDHPQYMTEAEVDAKIAEAMTSGKATLAITTDGSEVVVSSSIVAADSKIIVTPNSHGVTGTPRAAAEDIIPGVSFKIVSNNNLDAGDVTWLILS